MNDFRLRVFISVARNLSFTKASKELYISQPAISKHIQEIESIYGVQLFVRSGNTIELTPAAEIFLRYSEEIIEKYKELKFELDLINENINGELRIGASSTIAQYLLPEIIAGFMNRFPEIKLSVQTGNSEHIENLLSSHKIDLGIIEGCRRKREFHYSLLAKDELVLITSAKNKTAEEISIEKLKELPLILREGGSGTLDVIEESLKSRDIKISDLNVVMQLGSTESIKRLLGKSRYFAIISISAVINELMRNELKVIDIEDLTIEREFAFVLLTGSKNHIADHFMEFAKLSNNQKL